MDQLLLKLERACLSEPDNPCRTRQLSQAYQRAGQKYSGPVLDRAIQLLTSTNRFKREKAARTLVSLGPQAVGAVEKCLASKRWPVRQKAAEVLRRMGPDAAQSFDTMLGHKDLNVRREAIKAFAHLRDQSKIPDIISSTMETSLAFLNFSAKSISTIDPSILKQLAQELKVPNSPRFRQTIIFMDAFGKAAAPHYLELLKEARDINYFIRQRVASLGEKALKAMSEALSDPGTHIKLEILWTLQAMVDVPGTLPLLERLLEDEESRVRQQAVESLVTFSYYSELPSLALWLDRALIDDSEAVRQAAVEAVLRLEAKTEQLLPTLLSHWDVFDRGQRIRLAQLFLEQGSEKTLYLDAWRRLLHDEELIVRMKALYGLRSLKSKAQALLPELKALSEDASGSFRTWLLRAMKKIVAD